MSACSSNGRQRGSGSPLSAGKKSTRSTPATWCRGRAPHRAEAFVAMRKGKDRSLAVTTLHTKPGRRKIQPDTRRKGPTESHWTRRPQGTNRGAGRTRGDAARRKRANPKQPKQHKKTPQTTEGRHKQHLPKAKTHSQHHRTPTGKHTSQTTTDAPGQTKQAGKKSKPIDTGPNTLPEIGKRKRSTLKDRRPTRQPRRKVAKSQENLCSGRNECTCPVCGQTHSTKMFL